MALDDGAAGKVDSASALALVARICRAGVRSIPVAGVAVSVMTSGGHRGVVFVTDDTARSLEDVQFIAGEGPGCDAFAWGRAVLVSDLGVADERDGAWPAFREAARAVGVRAVFAFPLLLGAATLGALTAYRLGEEALTGLALARAVRLADAAAVAVLDVIVGADHGRSAAAGDGDDGDEVVDAQMYRAEVYQAAGVLMVQLAVGIETAMVRLRAYAFASGRPIAEVARAIVGHDLLLGAE